MGQMEQLRQSGCAAHFDNHYPTQALCSDPQTRSHASVHCLSEPAHPPNTAGIVFIDEIDKIVTSTEHRYGGDASAEGVQRDLLPIIEGEGGEGAGVTGSGLGLVGTRAASKGHAEHGIAVWRSPPASKSLTATPPHPAPSPHPWPPWQAPRYPPSTAT